MDLDKSNRREIKQTIIEINQPSIILFSVLRIKINRYHAANCTCKTNCIQNMQGNVPLFSAFPDFCQNSIIRLSSIQIGLYFNADSQSSQTNYYRNQFINIDHFYFQCSESRLVDIMLQTDCTCKTNCISKHAG